MEFEVIDVGECAECGSPDARLIRRMGAMYAMNPNTGEQVDIQYECHEVGEFYECPECGFHTPVDDVI